MGNIDNARVYGHGVYFSPWNSQQMFAMDRQYSKPDQQGVQYRLGALFALEV